MTFGGTAQLDRQSLLYQHPTTKVSNTDVPVCGCFQHRAASERQDTVDSPVIAACSPQCAAPEAASG